MEGVLANIWIAVAGFFIGRCSVLDICPLAVGFYIAVCIYDKKKTAAFFTVLLGLFFEESFGMFRYGMILLGIFAVSCLTDFCRQKNHVLSILAFTAYTVIVDVIVYIAFPAYMPPALILPEAGLVFSSAMMYLYGLRVLTEDYMRIPLENEAAVSSIFLLATVLFGMPVEISEFVVAETFALLTILAANYKFGFGIGVSWTVIAGAIMSGRIENVQLIAAWLVIALGSYAISCILHGGRWTYVITFLVMYYLTGFFAYDFLLAENSQKAIISAAFLFLLLPAGFLVKIDARMKSGELIESSPEWAKLVIGRIHGLALALKRIEFSLAGDGGAIGVSELGTVLDRFAGSLDTRVPMRKTIEAEILYELSTHDIEVKNLVMLKNENDIHEIYLTSRIRRGRIVGADTVRLILEKNLGLRLEIKDESRSIVSRNYSMICMAEKPEYRLSYAVGCMKKYEDDVSGDNYYIGDILNHQKLIMIADGMGSGEAASKDSGILIDTMDELLSAGFDNDLSIKLINSFLASKNRGESFSTLDMLLLDMYTGSGRLYKQGAATTFIKRGEWMEMIKSTSLPVGVIQNADCEQCSKKFYENDIIIMLSDGILENIVFENKEDFLRGIIAKADAEPEEIAALIIDSIRNHCGRNIRDDATLIVAKLVKNL